MPAQVLFIADDFGLSAEVNDAIVQAHVLGALHGAALMMGQPGTHEAVALARRTPTLQIGWHLHLTDSLPTTTARWPWGSSPARAGWAIGLLPAARRLMREEVARQWQLFQATGLECRFINSHHHLHAHPFVYREVRHVVGPQFQGWLRQGCPRTFTPNASLRLAAAADHLLLARRRQLSPWRTSDTLWGLDRLCHMNPAEINAARASLPDGLHEFIFHPRTRSCPDTLCLLALA